MNDKDVQRLEDRIAASEERSQLRLEKFAERIEGALARIVDQTTAIRQELHEQRADNRSLRTEIGQAVTEIRTEIAEQLSKHKTTETTHFHWVMATLVAMGIGLAALLLGLGQIWGNGVQVGQALPHAAQNTSSPAPPSVGQTKP